MAFNMSDFLSRVDLTVNTVKAKYEKAYKVVDITAKGKDNLEKESVRTHEDTRTFDD